MKTMMNISAQTLAEKVMELKAGQSIEVSMYYEGDGECDPEQWVRVERMDYFDSPIVIMGGYGYRVEIIANEQQLYIESKKFGIDEITDEILAYAMIEFDTDCRYMAIEVDVTAK